MGQVFPAGQAARQRQRHSLSAGPSRVHERAVSDPLSPPPPNPLYRIAIIKTGGARVSASESVAIALRVPPSQHARLHQPPPPPASRRREVSFVLVPGGTRSVLRWSASPRCRARRWTAARASGSVWGGTSALPRCIRYTSPIRTGASVIFFRSDGSID